MVVTAEIFGSACMEFFSQRRYFRLFVGELASTAETSGSARMSFFPLPIFLARRGWYISQGRYFRLFVDESVPTADIFGSKWIGWSPPPTFYPFGVASRLSPPLFSALVDGVRYHRR